MLWIPEAFCPDDLVPLSGPFQASLLSLSYYGHSTGTECSPGIAFDGLWTEFRHVGWDFPRLHMMSLAWWDTASVRDKGGRLEGVGPE